jgi:phage repressor protein C with HTH and peptisase S24 domain
MDSVRITLEELIRARGDDFLSISRMLGRNAAYIQQFVKRGIPRKLDEEDRRVLATYFGVSETLFGGQPDAVAVNPVVAMPILDLRASAGPGAIAGEENARSIGMDRVWLRRISANPNALSMIRVTGNSMEPTLADGDDIMVDSSDATSRLRDGIYVIRLDDALMVKRLELEKKNALAVRSDNDDVADLENVDVARVAIVGRVVWTGRKIH